MDYSKIKTKKDIEEYAHKLSIESFSIAVESIIFDKDMNWYLMKRGPKCRDEVGKLEGAGGRLEDSDSTLVIALNREIIEEIGDQCRISVLQLFDIKVVTTMDNRTNAAENWMIVSYICRLESGHLINKEPGSNDGFYVIPFESVKTDDLSNSTHLAYISLKKRYKEVYELIGGNYD